MRDRNVPKLRFKGFSDEWEAYELGEIAEISKSKYNPSKSQENYKCVELEHIAQNDGRIIGYIDSKEQSSIKNKFYEGEVLFGKLRPYLKKYWLANFEGVCSSEIWVLKGKGISNKFLYRIVQSDRFDNIANVSAGSKMPRADWNYMSTVAFSVPKIEEQEKIANFLNKVDNIIEKQEEKVSSLEKYKKGMMQKIFSQEIRFKKDDGGEYLEWEEKRASELFKNISDKNHNGELEVLSVTQDRGVMLRSELDIDIKFDLESVKNYKRVKPGDFIISLRSFQGGFELTNIEGLISPAYTVFNFVDGSKFNEKYFGYVFKSETFIKKLAGLIYGVRDGKAISFSDFSAMKFKYPSLEEQNRIAKLLFKIDSIIEKEKEKLEELRVWKKGLLQQMFV